MLLPFDMNPETSIFYYGALVLKKIISNGPMDMLELFNEMKKEADISITSYSLTLDWLYMINAAIVKNNGVVSICSSEN